MIRISHLSVLYFYSSDGSSTSFHLPVLQDALSKALATFYPLAGRLKRAETGRIEISCSGAGALLVEASTDSVLHDLGDFTPSMELQKLIPAIDYSNQNISSSPIFLAQVTYFKCGGVSIGMCIHHTVVDMISSVNFINHWSQAARGLHLSIPTFMDRHPLQARDPPTPLFDHVEYQDSPSLNTPPQSTQQSKTSPLVAKLTISLDQLNLLKSKLPELETQRQGNAEYTSLEMLAGHVWRCMCEARNLARDQQTKIYIPTDARARLSPAIPPGYFGNAVFLAAAVAAAGDLLSGSTSIAVSRVHDALARMDDEYLRSALNFLELQPDPNLVIRRADTFRCPNVAFVSWAEHPLYEADFGWGRPMYVGPAKVLSEGQAYLLPSPPDQSSLYSLVISLQEQHMEPFLMHFYDI
ncbi:hypothetical protein ACLOJK_041616 [Asimina triloba]